MHAYSYDRRLASSPLGEFDTPERVESFRVFVRKLSWWMGMSTPAGIKELLVVLKADPFLQKWLTRYVNPASEQLYYGGRLGEPVLPEVGSQFKRFRGVLQWSRHKETARWFAGLLNGAKPEPGWVGGVLCEGKASGREILLDIDALSVFLGRQRAAFEAMQPNKDALGILNGKEYEGEVLTTGAVKAYVVEARLF